MAVSILACRVFQAHKQDGESRVTFARNGNFMSFDYRLLQCYHHKDIWMYANAIEHRQLLDG